MVINFVTTYRCINFFSRFLDYLDIYILFFLLFIAKAVLTNVSYCRTKCIFHTPTFQYFNCINEDTRLAMVEGAKIIPDHQGLGIYIL